MIIDRLLLDPVLLSIKGYCDLLDEVLEGCLLVEDQRRLDECQRLVVGRDGVFACHHNGIYEARTIGVLLECGGELGLMINGFGRRLVGLGDWLVDGLEQLHELVLGTGILTRLWVGRRVL